MAALMLYFIGYGLPVVVIAVAVLWLWLASSIARWIQG